MGKTTFKDLTTFKVGGEIDNYLEVSDRSSLVSALTFAQEKNLDVFVIGWGSDIVVSDNPFHGLVIKITAQKVNEVKDESKKQSILLTAQAGLGWDDLVSYAVKKNLGGIELLSGIPGTCGSAPVQNIGAFGQELADTLVFVEVYDRLLKKFRRLSKKDCHFSYRESIFKTKEGKNRFVIYAITLRLATDYTPLITYETIKKYFDEKNIKKPTLKEVRDAVLEVRSRRIEDYQKVPNAGSFFKNPLLNKEKIRQLKEKYPEIPCFENLDGSYKCFAGWFIENAGWKGRSLGEAKVSDKHALILTNPNGKATATEIKNLSDAIRADVWKKFGVELEPEVQFINF